MKKLFLFLTVLIVGCKSPVPENADFFENLMKTQPEQFNQIIKNCEALEVQILYTQINRDEKGVPSFKQFRYNVDSTRYFYPASTIKLPLCLLALEKINELNITGLDKYTTMLHDSVYAGQLAVTKDSTSETGMPSVAHYIKRFW